MEKHYILFLYRKRKILVDTVMLIKNDIPEMTTLHRIFLSQLTFLCMLSGQSQGWRLYVNALNVLIINICFELYFKLGKRLSNQVLTRSLYL